MENVQRLQPRVHLKIAGRLNLNRYENDMVLEPLTIETAEQQVKQDTAPEKAGGAASAHHACPTWTP